MKNKQINTQNEAEPREGLQYSPINFRSMGRIDEVAE
jgi:hypothetical protein